MKQSRIVVLIVTSLTSLAIGYGVALCSLRVASTEPQPSGRDPISINPDGSGNVVVSIPSNNTVSFPDPRSGFQISFPPSVTIPPAISGRQPVVVNFPSGGKINLPACAPSGKAIRIDGESLRVKRDTSAPIQNIK